MNSIYFKHFYVLLNDGIFGFGQYLAQSLSVERVEIGQYRQTTYDFRNQTERFQILRRNILQQIFPIYGIAFFIYTITYHLRIQTHGDFLFYTVKSTATNEENIFRVDGYHFLVGMFTTALRGDIHDRPLEQFQQSLLYTFSADIASYRRVISFSGNFVNFIDKYNTSFGRIHIIIRNL